ncbi:MAG: hypothetical protein ACRDSP_15515 [Pseudonocardiaceae bacterium]
MRGADVPLRLGPVVIEIGRWVYGTVILMTVLVVYADEGPVTFGESAGIVVTQLLATFLAHLFAGVLVTLNRADGGLSRRDFAELVRSEAQYIMLTVPPLAVLLAGAVGAYDAPTAVSLIVRGGVALLVALGALGGKRAGLRPWGVAACAVGSGVLGLLVLVAQVLLKL